MQPDQLAVYTTLWGLSTQLEHIKGPLGGPPGPWLVSVLLLCLAAALRPQNRTLAAVAFSMRCVWWLSRWPFMWASEIIGGLTDLSVVLHLIAADRHVDDSNGVGLSVRRQVAWFYVFAGFWKLNTSFLDHRYSCASVFIAQLLDAHAPPHLLTPDNVELAIRAAPALTVALELGVGVCMLLGEYATSPVRVVCRPAGVVLALLLHLGIDVTPPPHNIANFSHKIGLRYLWFAPHGTTAAACEVLRRPLSVGAAYAALAAASLALTVALQQPAVWAQWTSSPLSSLRELNVCSVDWHVSAHVALTALLLRGLWLGEGRAARTHAVAPPWALVHFNTAICILWAGGTVVLGTSDNSTPNMYSNLRQQGGSNHLLPVPMSLLQAWRYQGHAVGADPFSGGLVRIEHHNSTHMAGYCPAETTPHLSAGAIALLRGSGHSGRVFNPAFALNIGPHAMPPRPPGPFVRYTLPAFELRRQLHEARQAAETFELTYTSLPGATGDERWRATAAGRSIKLVVAGADARASVCTVLNQGPGGADRCQVDDIALAPWWTRDWAKPFDSFLGGLQSWNPQPLIWEEQTELHCYG